MATSTTTAGENISDFNNNANSTAAAIRAGKNYEKYSLRPRSIQNRIETEKRRKEPKKQPKPKSRAPPLSKYRRKTANARERGRMQDINTAFEALQRAVPQYPILPVNAQGKTCEKLTKITTLKLAMNYIRCLSKLLDPSDSTSASTSSSSSASEGLASTSTTNSMADMDDFCSSGSSAEFSPASSYTLSPLACSPPDCIQTVMRSFVLPTTVVSASTPRNNGHLLRPSLGSVIPGSVVVPPPPQQLQHPHHQPQQQQQLYMPVATTVLPPMTKMMNYHRLPPTTVKFSAAALSQSVSSLLAECTGAGGSNRAGSLSSLTESDLSEYTSDLLSDEGSTLDDPMFEDIIGVGVGMGTDDLDLLLESDGDSLHFSSDLSDN